VPRISRDHRDAIEAYVAQLKNRLRLDDWIVELLDEMPVDKDGDPHPGISGQVRTNTFNRYANLRLGDRFFDFNDLTNQHRTQTLIHELLHLHFEHTWHFVSDLTENEMSVNSGKLADNVFRFQMERAIDQLAWALTDLLPLFKLPDNRAGARRS
jgi:hypothetical protein